MFSHQLIFLCFCILMFCYVDAQRIFGCKDYCQTNEISCRDVGSCENGTIIKNADYCGCCDSCVLWLKEGEECERLTFSSIPRHACGPQLECDKKEKKCAPVKTQCMADTVKHDSIHFLEDLPYITDRPKCDEFGHYKSMVCLSDILCYCVDKDGKRIFGTEIASKVNQSRLEEYCRCSRAYDEFPRNVPNGDFLRCLPDGNFDELQCTEEWCYCMESDDPDIIEAAKFNTSLKDLSCYNEKLHKDFDATFRSKCWNERNDMKQMIKKHEDWNIAIIGVDLPNCDLDGSYAPVQCKGDSCFCVDKDGDANESEYTVPRYSKEAKEMDCNCARDKFLIRQEKDKTENMKLFGMVECAKNGNFKPKESTYVWDTIHV